MESFLHRLRWNLELEKADVDEKFREMGIRLFRDEEGDYHVGVHITSSKEWEARTPKVGNNKEPVSEDGKSNGTTAHLQNDRPDSPAPITEQHNTPPAASVNNEVSHPSSTTPPLMEGHSADGEMETTQLLPRNTETTEGESSTTLSAMLCGCPCS